LHGDDSYTMIDSLEKYSDAVLILCKAVQQRHIMWVKRSDGTDSFMYLKT